MSDVSKRVAPPIGSMPCITLWQPYASLVASGAKRYETRSWAPPERLLGQRIAIHAAARKLPRAELNECFDDVAEEFGCHWHLRMPYGAVVCTALLQRCWTVSSYTPGGLVQFDGCHSHQDDGFGDYRVGRKCWELAVVQEFIQPVPAKGNQGWWTWQGASP